MICVDCGATKELHKIENDYYCSDCLEDKYMTAQEQNFTKYWEGE